MSSARRVRRRHWVAVDCAAALFFSAVDVVNLVMHGFPSGLPGILDPLLDLVVIVAVVARRLHPEVSLVVALCATAGVGILHRSPQSHTAIELFSLVYILSLVAIRATLKRTVFFTIVTCAVVMTVAERISPVTFDPSTLSWYIYGIPTIVFGSAALGLQIRRSRILAQIRSELQAERRARRAVRDERLRIAREMHDVLSHSIGVITVEAELKAEMAESRPELAVPTLRSIAATGKQATRDIRRIIGLIRMASLDSPVSDQDSFDPAGTPKLRDIDRLVAGALAAKVRVSLQIAGDVRILPSSVEFAGYRIVQESLTNAVKHSDSGDVGVSLGYGAEDLEIEVVNDGAVVAEPPDGAGHGLTGMRERVALFGGEFDAGPRPGGGFRVYAKLPLGGGPDDRVAKNAAAPRPAGSGNVLRHHFSWSWLVRRVRIRRPGNL